MGSGVSLSADKTVSIDNELQTANVANAQLLKLILLGPGDSGKTTVYRQMWWLSSPASQDLSVYSSIIHENVIFAIQALINAARSSNLRLASENESMADSLIRLRDPVVVTPEIAGQVKSVFADPAIQATLEKRNQLHLPEHARYFMTRLDQICDSNWTPTQEDAMRSRRTTTGIAQHRFTLRGSDVLLIDVGGQRSERRKWINCFQDVTAVIFVCALSEYDQTLFEDPTQNRAVESLELFESLTSNPLFAQTTFFLVFNKLDLLPAKLSKTPISLVFPDYAGPNDDVEAVKMYFQNLYHSRVKPGQRIFSRFISALDCKQVDEVITSVVDITAAAR